MTFTDCNKIFFKKNFFVFVPKILFIDFFIYYCNTCDKREIMSKKIMYTLEYPIRCSPAILFEFRITQSSITNETILRITDFADKNDLKDSERLWSTQINDLKHRIGS